MTWTDARINVLREMWPKPECSASTIAAYLGGITRMAVIGKASRLGLKGNTKTSMTPGAIYRRKHRGRRKPAQQFSVARVAGEPTVALPAPAAHVMACEPCSLLELTNCRCRFPIGNVGEPDFHFCGARDANLAHNEPYCAAHHRMAYSP